MVKAMPEPAQIDTDDADGSSQSSRKRLTLVLGAVLLVVAAVAGVFFLRGPGEEEEPAPPEDGPVVEVAQMTANLAGSQLRYARFGFAVVLRDDAVPDDVEARFPLLQDAAISTVQTFDPDLLRTPEGLDEFRKRLTAHAGDIYPDEQILRVVLTEMVVQ